MGIASDIKQLGEDIAASYDTRVKAIGVLVSDVQKALKGFATDRGKMSKEQEKVLKDFVTDLTNNVGDMVKGNQKEHKDMAGALKESLKKGEADRRNAFNDMMGNIQKDIKDIETYIGNQLKEFSDAHAEMSEELKKELAKYVDDMVNVTEKLMGEFKTEREKMSANWQALTATMAKKRGGIVPKVAPEVKVKPVTEVMGLKNIVEEEEEEEEIEEPALEEKVLEFINSRPEGVRVGDMEEPLEATPMRLGKIAKVLLREGKVRKERNLYFPLY